MRLGMLVCVGLLLFAQLAASTATSSTPPRFNLKDCRYEVNKEWTKVSVGVSGGAQPYEFYFDQYPEGWKYIGSDVYVPKASLSKNQRNPCKMRIMDRNGNQARGSVVFDVLDGKVSISDTLFAYDKIYDDSFFNSGKFKSRPNLVKSSSYYNEEDKYDFTNYEYYTSAEDMEDYDQRANRLNSGRVSSSIGTGLDFIFTEDDFYNAFTDRNTFSLAKIFSFGQKAGGSTSTSESSSSSGRTSASSTVSATANSQTGGSKTATATATVQPSAGSSGRTTTSGGSSSGSFSFSASSNPTSNNYNGFDGWLSIFGRAGSTGTKGTTTATTTSTTNNNNNNNLNSFNDYFNFYVPSKAGTRITSGSTGSNRSNSTGGSTSSSGTVVISGSGVSSATVKKTDSVFIKLPTTVQIDNLILAGDLFGLTKVIQDVNKTSGYSCEQKVSYLNDLLGRVQSAISMKAFAADQLQSVVDAATANYNNLIIQINQKNEQIKSLNITSLKEKLRIDLTTLEGLYAQYNAFDTNLTPLEAQIDAYNRDIAIQRAKSDVDRQELIRQKLAYNEADAYVKKIQRQLNDAKARKSLIEATISKFQTVVTDSETQIKSSQDNIVQLEIDIKTLEGNTDQLKLTYQNLESQVERYRADISRGSKREQQYLNEIAILEERLNIERKKLANEELNKLKEMVAALSKSIPTIQTFVDDNYYKCYRATSLATQQAGSVTVYVITIPNFQSYIETSYQIQPDWTRVNLVGQEIRLTPINIMDSAWQAAYGLPYDIVSYASSKDFSFPSDFNCLNPSTLISGMGLITSISNRYITIDNLQGGTQMLNLGTCSRLETTGFLPSIGQRVYWRGNPGTKVGEFNVYRASCI